MLAAILSNLGALYQTQGRYDQAEASFKQALRMREKLFGQDHPNVAQVLNNLAALNTERDRYVDALLLYQRALTIQRKALGNAHPDVGMTLHNLAALYLSQGRLADAEKLAQEAVNIWQRAGSNDSAKQQAAALTNLADIRRRQGQFAVAAALYQKALQTQKQALGEDYLGNAELMANLAVCSAGQRRFDEANKYQQQSIQTIERTLGPKHPKLVIAINHLLLARLVNDRTDGCEELADRAIAIGEASASGAENLHNSYTLRAELRWKIGKKEQALADLNHAMDLVDQQRGATIGAEHEQAVSLGSLTDVFAHGVAWHAELGHAAEAFEIAERGKARSLLVQMDLNGVDLLAGLPAADARILRTREAQARTRLASLQSYFNSLNESTDNSSARSEQQRIEAELGTAQADFLDVYRSIRNVSPTYRMALNKERKPVDLAHLQKRLAQFDSLLLEFVVDEEQTLLLTVPPSGEPRVAALAVTDELARALAVAPGPLGAEKLTKILSWEGKPLPRAFSSSPPSIELVRRLAALTQLLIPEPEQQLLFAGTLQHLIVVPDGPLSLLPFETLVVEDEPGLKYLLDVGPAISYQPSATVYENLSLRVPQSPPAGVQPVLTIADPLYISSPQANSRDDLLGQLTSRSRYGAAGGRFQALPNTHLESTWLADVFKQNGIAVARLEKASATEAAVRANAGNRRVLHLACHGVADEQFGNVFGALALSPGKDAATNPADDGFLTLAEIYELNLKGCELAILSACDTNYGPQQQGEGVWALSRGFLVAGARRVVASNWLVDDEAAASLISYFCGGVAKGEKTGAVDYAKSLHNAKRWVRRQEKWESPYYWGTFVLVGPN